MLQLRIEAIKWELPETATFFLKEVSGNKIVYKAGQFITLVFTHRSEEIRRSYSLSSAPHENLLAVTVKRQTNGEISRFMLTKFKVGDLIDAIEPAGRFTVTNQQNDLDLFFFAAGSGITPIFSILKHILGYESGSKLTLVYSSGTAAILFKTELHQLASEHPTRLYIHYFISSEGNRLNNLLVEQLVKQSSHSRLYRAEFYLCGPFDYMRMLRLTLLYMGIDARKIRKENFVVDTVRVAANSFNYPPGKVKIKLRGELHDIAVGENQSILQAALQNNIKLPYSCRVGACAVCTAICKSGKVVMAANEVLTDADLAEGWVLTCTGHPAGDDVVIEYPGAQSH